MRFLHSMVRVRDLDAALRFYVDLLGLREVRRTEHQQGRFTLVFLESGAAGDTAQVELTYSWAVTDPTSVGRSFGHLAFAVDDIYATCERLAAGGVPIARPPRDGRMAFVVSPDGVSIELLQSGAPQTPREPWQSAPNIGTW
jgi:lactoylglutathione lyase